MIELVILLLGIILLCLLIISGRPVNLRHMREQNRQIVTHLAAIEQALRATRVNQTEE